MNSVEVCNKTCYRVGLVSAHMLQMRLMEQRHTWGLLGSWECDARTFAARVLVETQLRMVGNEFSCSLENWLVAFIGWLDQSEPSSGWTAVCVANAAQVVGVYWSRCWLFCRKGPRLAGTRKMNSLLALRGVSLRAGEKSGTWPALLLLMSSRVRCDKVVWKCSCEMLVLQLL